MTVWCSTLSEDFIGCRLSCLYSVFLASVVATLLPGSAALAALAALAFLIASMIPPKKTAAVRFSNGTNGSKDLRKIDMTFT